MDKVESKSIFVVGIKLLGIYFICMALLSIPTILTFVTLTNPEIAKQSNFSSYIKPVYQLIIFILSFIWLISFGIFIIKKTEKIIKWNKFSSHSVKIPDKPFKNLLRIGIIILGLYIFIESVPKLFWHIYYLIKNISVKELIGFIEFGRLLQGIVGLVLSFFLCVKSNLVIQTINKLEKKLKKRAKK